MSVEHSPLTSWDLYVCMFPVCLFVCVQILNYLVACEHLCQLGYDMAQVEEALEMFQNCETKVRPEEGPSYPHCF